MISFASLRGALARKYSAYSAAKAATRSRIVAPNVSSLPLSGAGRTIGPVLMRIDRSGVETPRCARSASSAALTKARIARRGAELADHPVIAPFAAIDGDGAAQHRRDLIRRRQRVGQFDRRQRIARVLADMILGERDVMDHPVIGLFRRRAEGENAMLVENEAFDGRVGVENIGGGFGEREARHHIGHEAHFGAEDIRAHGAALALVGDRQNGGRMGVVDEFMRQEGVQQRLDRRIGRIGIEKIGALQRHHILVGKAVALARFQERRELHGGQAGRLDHAHVPAAALDAENVEGFADEIGRHGLDGSVAAAMQHEARIAAEQAGGVDAQREVAVDAFGGIGRGHGLGVAVVPEVFHGGGVSRGRGSLQRRAALPSSDIFV